LWLIKHWFSASTFVVKVATFAKPQTVTSNPKKTDSATMNRQKRHRDSQPFAKLKEVFCQRTCRHKNTTFNFAQPHPKPTHHPTKWTEDN
jgi:hypothetical protein